MSNSPWSAYGRSTSVSTGGERATAADSPVAGVVNEVMRGREKLDRYLQGVLREYFAIQSGDGGYRSIIADALTPSARPETVEERLNRLARESQSRRPQQPPRRQRSR